VRDFIRDAGGLPAFILQAIGGTAMMAFLLWGLPILAVAFGVGP
jgi:hypothetical protein